MTEETLHDLYSECELCPRRCRADRTKAGNVGRCGGGAKAAVNLAMLHYGEEPVISGVRGSGTVFFEGCPLGCIFCQNHDISLRKARAEHEQSPGELADIFVALQEQGAHNINLVTALHYAPSVVMALELVRGTRLHIPVAVNTGGYELPETLGLLDGLVDIYMPDLKFFSPALADATCRAPDYYEIACAALDSMYEQVGPVQIGDDGMLKKGLVIRHLMMPGKLFDTKKILDHIIRRFGNKVYISLMNQYTPMPNLPGNAPDYLRRTVPAGHYEAAVRYIETGLEDSSRVFIQEGAADGDEMIPKFL